MFFLFFYKHVQYTITLARKMNAFQIINKPSLFLIMLVIPLFRHFHCKVQVTLMRGSLNFLIMWKRLGSSLTYLENLGLYTLLPLIYHEAEMVNRNYHFVLEHNLTSDKRKGSKFCQKKLYELWPKYESEDITTSEFLNSCIQFVPF